VIPIANPGARFRKHRQLIESAFGRVLDSGRYILSEEVNRFETIFAAYVGSSYGIGVGNGTDALHLALRGLGIGSGDEVITVSHTAVATCAAIEHSGAILQFADIDLHSYTIDPTSIAEAITKRTRAIVPVHLYGHPADMKAILDIANEHGLRVIEDCAQAHGATVEGKSVGSFGVAAIFSFYPTKNLGGLGDGGMIVCNDEALAQRIRVLRQYGWKTRYISDSPGYNSRLDELHAAVLADMLPFLDEENRMRQAIAEQYSTGLSGCDLTLPVVDNACEHVYHQFVIRTHRRDDLRQALRARGIGSGIHYPLPVHLQPAYQSRYPEVSLPNSESAADEILSLPVYPELTDEDITRVIKATRSYFGV